MKIARDHTETREDQAKRLNPSYRPYSKGKPSQVIFRLKVSRLLGIMLYASRVFLGCSCEQNSRLLLDSSGISKI